MAFATITFPTTICYFFRHFALKQEKNEIVLMYQTNKK